MRLLEGHDAAVAQFVHDFAPLEKPLWKPGFRGFGVIRESDGLLVAGVVFDDWHPNEKRVEMSGAAIDPRAFGPRTIRALGAYAFGKLDAHRVWARTSLDNRRARKLLKGLGFIEESTQASWYGPGVHAVTLRVLKPEWERRWSDERRLAA